MPCVSCKEVFREWLIPSPRAFTEAIRLVRRGVSDGILEQLSGPRPWQEVSLEDLADEGPWPDVVEALFECRLCGDRFALSVETYHGSGGSWAPHGSQGRSDATWDVPGGTADGWLQRIPKLPRDRTRKFATLEDDSWELESGEIRHRKRPDTFWIPDRAVRENLRIGQAAKLLFRIRSADGNEIGVERMWAIVVERMGNHYLGILDDEPASTGPAHLHAGTEFLFTAVHVIDIDDPPRAYLVEKYGKRLKLDDLD